MAVSYAVNGLRKEFAGRPAVDNATFEVAEGSIHGVIGKNGAGKSVLMNLVSGVMESNSGELTIAGQQVNTQHGWTPTVARRLGVMLIPQDPPRLPYLTVEDYLFLGDRASSHYGILDRRTMRRKVGEINERLELRVGPGDMMSTLPVEVQQLLAFGKSVFLEDARVVLLDEITASLSGARRVGLLRLLRELVQGRSFTLITHHINEVISACDRVTVMRDGISVDTLDVRGVTPEVLAAKIVGEAGAVKIGNGAIEPAEEVLRVTGLSSSLAFQDVSFSVRRHEVVGLAGVDGSGKDEVLEALGGLRRTSGRIELGGRTGRFDNPVAATRAGVALLPKNRERLATIHHLSVMDNLILPVAARFRNRFGFLSRPRMRRTAVETIDEMQVKTPGPDAVINSLSGGNRQKVMMGRLRLMNPKVYLLNEPTRGVDIATKPQLLSIIRRDLASRSAVIMTSESEDELVEACDRVLVFFKGRIVRELLRADPQFTVGEIYRTGQGVDVR